MLQATKARISGIPKMSYVPACHEDKEIYFSVVSASFVLCTANERGQGANASLHLPHASMHMQLRPSQIRVCKIPASLPGFDLGRCYEDAFH